MSYSTDITKLLTEQLGKFVTLNKHQLAGQVVNLDFWLEEVKHCLGVLDGYKDRFDRLCAAQDVYVSAHRTTEFGLDDPVGLGTRAAPPRRVSTGEFQEAKRTLREVVYRLLVRCQNEGFIQENDLRSTCAEFGIGVEVRDLKRR